MTGPSRAPTSSSASDAPAAPPTERDRARFRLRIERLRARLERGPASSTLVAQFRRLVLGFYARHGRDLPWRRTTDPYRVLVSEIMLQQTQVPRVVEKYAAFLEAFPDVESLATAATKDVLAAWQGLGYNRRAIALQRAARAVSQRHCGLMPQTVDELVELPGIGPATAADIVAFAFNRPAVVIETNIRAVFIHLFFGEGERVDDGRIGPLVERTMDRRDPRRWYNALMDFGVLVKQLYGNPARRSAQYVRQSRFEGSNRQLRSRILRHLLGRTPAAAGAIACALDAPRSAVKRNLDRMAGEGLLRRSRAGYTVA